MAAVTLRQPASATCQTRQAQLVVNDSSSDPGRAGDPSQIDGLRRVSAVGFSV